MKHFVLKFKKRAGGVLLADLYFSYDEIVSAMVCSLRFRRSPVLLFSGVAYLHPEEKRDDKYGEKVALERLADNYASACVVEVLKYFDYLDANKAENLRKKYKGIIYKKFFEAGGYFGSD
jgi:hypothetical protein